MRRVVSRTMIDLQYSRRKNLYYKILIPVPVYTSYLPHKSHQFVEEKFPRVDTSSRRHEPVKSSRLVRARPRRVLPCSRHRKHWLVSCRGSVRCRSTAGAKRAASKHGSRETFQSDRQACIRHGSWVPKAPAGWTPCSQRAAHAAVRASWAHSLAARSRTRRGLPGVRSRATYRRGHRAWPGQGRGLGPRLPPATARACAG